MSSIIETESKSSIMENESIDNKTATIKSKYTKRTKICTYILAFVVVAIVVGIIYCSCMKFKENQETDVCDSFLEKTIKSGPADDKSFDVDAEVKRLSELQESYLEKLKLKRNS
jgi:hypothetical protein